MKNKSVISVIALSIFSLILSSCASSTGSRYSKDGYTKPVDSSTITTSNKNDIKLIEDFNISPYKIDIEVPEKNKISNIGDNNNIWFDYSSTNPENQQKVLVGTKEGYRVLVISIDNLEDANKIKSELTNLVDDNEIYIDFEPPFYKLEVGDFDNQKSADNLRFKLNQLGYKEAKVVQETINIFK